MAGFKSTRRKGFHIGFDNGLTVSVQWGSGNYCDNHWDSGFNDDHDWQSSDAEVAIWHKEHPSAWDFLDIFYFLPGVQGEGHGGVCGYLDPEDVAELLFAVSNETDNFLQKYETWYKNTYGEELDWHD